ncbi:MAG: TIM barrel protein, partial [Anaerolineae bacterium]|nr:TIM barrel protein [Anaerolineae bacterium]
LPDEATRLVHHYGLDGSICDLNSYRPSDLVITDAVYTLEGNFPSEGSPVKTDLITVADNVVAADLVAARLMGVASEELFYLQEAIARGLGPASLDEVALLGDDLEATAAQMQFEQAPRDPEPHRGPFHLRLGDMCVSCRQALAGGLLAVSHREELAHLQGMSIVAGHHQEAPAVGDDRVLIYGNCAYRYRHLGHYEPGCPPLAGQVARGLSALAPRTIWPAMCSIAWREEPIEHVIPKVAGAGYAGLEAWGPHVERYFEEHGEIASLAELLDASQLQVPMLSGYFDLAHDLEASLERTARYVRYAQSLGAPLIRVFTGGGDSAQASIATWRAVTAGLEQMCALGLDREIGFALETHDGRLHDTTPTTLRLLRQVNAPNLWVNLDIFNLFAAGEDPLRALERLMPWIRIVHLKNGVQEEGRWRHGVPLAAGAMDYGAFLGALVEHNYGGFVSIEWFGPDPEGAAVSELAYVRETLGDTLGQRETLRLRQ